MAIRALLNSKVSSIVIGSSGKPIQELSRKLGVRFSVSGGIDGVNDRILTVIGSADKVSEAFGSISQLLIDSPSPTQSPDEKTVVDIRLLFPNQYMEALIGRQDSKINQMQADHQVKLVAHEEPPYPSSERVVDISGDVKGIQSAIREIAEMLESNRDRNTQRIQPNDRSKRNQKGHDNYNAGGDVIGAISLLKPNFRVSMPTESLYDQQKIPLDSEESLRYRRTSNSNMTTNSSDSTTESDSAGDHNSTPSTSADLEVETETIYVPFNLIGSIIGQRGSRIEHIRTVSGSNIRITDAPNADGNRSVTIMGSAKANNRALGMIYEQLEAEREKLEPGKAANAEQEQIEHI